MNTTVTTQQLSHIAHLARLTTGEVNPQLAQDLQDILHYVSELAEAQNSNSVNTKSQRKTRSIPLAHLRKDVPPTNPEQYARHRQGIISLFPVAQGDLLILPGIFHD